MSTTGETGHRIKLHDEFTNLWEWIKTSGNTHLIEEAKRIADTALKEGEELTTILQRSTTAELEVVIVKMRSIKTSIETMQDFEKERKLLENSGAKVDPYWGILIETA